MGWCRLRGGAPRSKGGKNLTEKGRGRGAGVASPNDLVDRPRRRNVTVCRVGYSEGRGRAVGAGGGRAWNSCRHADKSLGKFMGGRAREEWDVTVGRGLLHPEKGGEVGGRRRSEGEETKTIFIGNTRPPR